MWKTIFKFETKEQVVSLIEEIDKEDNYSVDNLSVIFKSEERFTAEGMLDYYSYILNLKNVDFDYSLEGEEEDTEPISNWEEYGVTEKDFL